MPFEAVQQVANAESLEGEVRKRTKKCFGSTSGLILGLVLICYGGFNTFLYFKFTPVYKPTSCGNQVAYLDRFSISDTINVGMDIDITCSNPNNYIVGIQTSQPGNVWAGQSRSLPLGQLHLIDGSSLPERGEGTLSVRMDASIPISLGTTKKWANRFLTSPDIPIFLELRFNVRIDVTFGLMRFGTAAPFQKKCGLVLAGLFVNTDRRLSAVVCRDSFEAVTAALQVEDIGHADPMTFGAAQMDPERIHLGEMAKNIGIIIPALVSFGMGIALIVARFVIKPDVEEPPISAIRPRNPVAAAVKDLKNRCLLGCGCKNRHGALVMATGTEGNEAPSYQKETLLMDGSGPKANSMQTSGGSCVRFFSCSRSRGGPDSFAEDSPKAKKNNPNAASTSASSSSWFSLRGAP
mmetsp:Transcript_1737/g.3853  ORF Transcript_1737/g.3853 Transcript_1737/m.3853 type:complete len:408 (-) Transcript_1737:32-1255(-)